MAPKLVQEQGFVGRQVGNMIRRSVRSRFHNVYWTPPPALPADPIIFVPNHNGWFDGYLMFLAVSRLGKVCMDWIAEYDSFPLFSKIGGMPFPPDNPSVRAQTIKRTIRSMQQEGRSLLLFAEATLHYPPDVWEFGKSLDLVLRSVPNAQVGPVAIQYEMAMHERPEAFLSFGPAFRPNDASRARERVVEELAALRAQIRAGHKFEILHRGKRDVNERFKFPGKEGR